MSESREIEGGISVARYVGPEWSGNDRRRLQITEPSGEFVAFDVHQWEQIKRAIGELLADGDEQRLISTTQPLYPSLQPPDPIQEMLRAVQSALAQRRIVCRIWEGQDGEADVYMASDGTAWQWDAARSKWTTYYYAYTTPLPQPEVNHG